MNPVHLHPVGRPSALAWEAAQVALLVVNLGWTTLCLGGYRAETLVVTSALTGVLLAVHLIARTLNRPLEGGTGDVPRTHIAGWLLAPFLGYAAINAAWITPVPWLGWRDWLNWAQPVAIFWVVLNGVRSRRSHTVIWITLFLLAIVAVLLAAYQRFGDRSWLMMGRTQSPQFDGRASGSFGVPNSLGGFLILFIPITLAGTFRRGATAAQRISFGYVGALLAMGLILTISRGAWLALAVTLAAWPLFGLQGSRVRRMMWAASIVLLFVMVASVLFTQLPGVRVRLLQLREHAGERSRPIMWRAAWEIFREHPIVGSGAGSYNIRFDQHRREDFQDEPVWAHNDYLNTLSDYGSVGFVLLFGAIAGLFWRASARRERLDDPGRTPADDRWWLESAVVGLIAFALQLLVEFHFKIPALGLTVGAIGAMVVQAFWRDQRPPASRSIPGQVLPALGAVGVVVLTFGWIVPQYRAEALREGARHPIDRFAASPSTAAGSWRQTLDTARRELLLASEIDPRNGAAWADLSYAIALSVPFDAGHEIELGREAEVAAQRALACSRAPAEFWIRRGVARDLQGRWVEAGSDYVTALQLAPTKGIVWYYHGVHMSLRSAQRALAVASLEFSLRLDPGNGQAQALAKRLADGSRASTSSSHAPD